MSEPSVAASGSAARRRRAGPKTTCALFRGSNSELWQTHLSMSLSPVAPFRPGSNPTPCVRANCRIGDVPSAATSARVIIQFGRVKPDDQHLIQPRTITDHRGIRILGPSAHGRPAEGQILRPDHLTCVFSFRDDENIGLLGSFITAGPVLVGSGRSGCRYPAAVARAVKTSLRRVGPGCIALSSSAPSNDAVDRDHIHT